MPFEFMEVLIHTRLHILNFMDLTYKSKGIEPDKRQLISEENFGVFNSSKKLENFNFCPSQGPLIP